MKNDSISRQDALDVLDEFQESVENGTPCYAKARAQMCNLQSIQPERLTDDDFETIRIHLNAYKEKLCNQRRWEEAEEYQRIIDRFIAFASAQPEPPEPEELDFVQPHKKIGVRLEIAQPEIIRCKDCKHRASYWGNCKLLEEKYHQSVLVDGDSFCSMAERRTDEQV